MKGINLVSTKLWAAPSACPWDFTGWDFTFCTWCCGPLLQQFSKPVILLCSGLPLMREQWLVSNSKSSGNSNGFFLHLKDGAVKKEANRGKLNVRKECRNHQEGKTVKIHRQKLNWILYLSRQGRKLTFKQDSSMCTYCTPLPSTSVESKHQSKCSMVTTARYI